jgi:hypothetical protein
VTVATAWRSADKIRNLGIERIEMDKDSVHAKCTLKVRGVVTASEAKRLIALVGRLEGRSLADVPDGRTGEVPDALNAPCIKRHPDLFGEFEFDEVAGGSMDEELLQMLSEFRLSWIWMRGAGHDLEPRVQIWSAGDEMRWTRPLYRGEIFMTVAEARDPDMVSEMEEVDDLFRQRFILDVVLDDDDSPASCHDEEALRIFVDRIGSREARFRP